MKFSLHTLVVVWALLPGCHCPNIRPHRAAAAASKPASVDDALLFPNLGFNDYQGALGEKVVALTFDDGPDGVEGGPNHTRALLDMLDTLNVRASFFVCGHLHTDVRHNDIAQEDLRRIRTRGHDLGSHSLNHVHMSTLSAGAIAAQFSDNLAYMQQVLGPEFTFSLYRLPYGHPYQTNNDAVHKVAPAAQAAGVHVGWGIDTDDWKCAQDGLDGNCILGNLRAQLNAGHSGPILMHSVYDLTVQTLPAVVQMLRERGYKLVTVEEMVQSKYGMSSHEVMTRHRRAHAADDLVAGAAQRVCAANQSIVVPY